MSPLGVFDSGLGGLTVVRELLRALPHERFIYLGDTARVPYGTRSPETVARYARRSAAELVDRGVKALVIACNTVSAVALDVLREEVKLPVVGVVEPGAEAAVRAAGSVNGGGGASSAVRRIGVLGTMGTVLSGAYPRAVRQLTREFEVLQQAAPLLVPLVEEGWIEGDVPRLAVRRYLTPLVEQGAEVILLGCTHYPLLKQTISDCARELRGGPVPIVDSAEVTATHVRRRIGDLDFLETALPSGGEASSEGPRLQILVTDLPRSFETLARQFLGDRDMPPVEQIDLVL